MAKIISPTFPPIVTVEFTREEALVVRAIIGRLGKEEALKVINTSGDSRYPLAERVILTQYGALTIYDALDEYFGAER